MKLTMAAGIRENPIDITNTMKIPFALAYLCFRVRVTGNA